MLPICIVISDCLLFVPYLCVSVCSFLYLIYSHTIPTNAINMSILFPAFGQTQCIKSNILTIAFNTRR